MPGFACEHSRYISKVKDGVHYERCSRCGCVHHRFEGEELWSVWRFEAAANEDWEAYSVNGSEIPIGRKLETRAERIERVAQKETACSHDNQSYRPEITPSGRSAYVYTCLACQATRVGYNDGKHEPWKPDERGSSGPDQETCDMKKKKSLSEQAQADLAEKNRILIEGYQTTIREQAKFIQESQVAVEKYMRSNADFVRVVESMSADIVALKKENDSLKEACRFEKEDRVRDRDLLNKKVDKLQARLRHAHAVIVDLIEQVGSTGLPF